MSGIVGIYYRDGKPVERETLGRMVDILAHRGPDGADVWCEGSVGLGHRMLWTTPESLLEKLPLANQTGDLVITADARIDNRDELIPQLKLDIFPKEKVTDSQIILAAYEKWGEQCPEKLLGDFAFAIWDRRSQQLFCARDPMGVKPFYYFCCDRVFVFASEIKALLCLPEVPSQLNELKVAYYLEMFFEDQQITFYQNIFRLKAAHYLTLARPKKKLIQSYWSLDPSREIRLNSDREYAEAFREIFIEAVRCRIRSAFPVGSALSGGLDSSSIACTARKLFAQSGNQQLHTFSAIFPSLPEKERRWIDERYYMKTVQALGGFQAHDIRADRLSPLIDLLWKEEEAILAPNLYIHQGLYHCANQQGVRVFLDGLDGDSTVCHGWYYITELAYTGRWRTLFQEITAASRRMRLSRRLIFQEYVLIPLLIEPATYLWQLLSGSNQIAYLVKDLINPTFAKEVEVTRHVKELLSHQPALTLTSRGEHWASLTSSLYPHTLEINDKAAAKFSLEARYPFFDRRLMEFCLALPSCQKFRQGWTRAILRFAMNDILPPEVQWRVNKSRLGSNFRRRLLEDERKTLERMVKKSPSIESYVNLSSLHAAYERYSFQLQKQKDNSPTKVLAGNDEMKVFAAVILGLWLNRVGFN